MPIINEGADRHAIAKVVEEDSEDAEAQEVRDEHNTHFIQNIIYTEDNSLSTEWRTCYCQPTTKHIEDAEYELFQSNQLPSFFHLRSV